MLVRGARETREPFCKERAKHPSTLTCWPRESEGPRCGWTTRQMPTRMNRNKMEGELEETAVKFRHAKAPRERNVPRR